jgi:hypothetical protein
MAENTKNLNLKKPAQNEFYNIDDFNENFQKIDDFAENVATKDHNHKNSHGGFEAGTGADASTGGAVGSGADATAGGAIGDNAETQYGGAVGALSKSNSGGAVGYGAWATAGGAVGLEARTGSGFAGGSAAKTMANDKTIDAIQLGSGTNPNPNTLQIYGYQLMDANGVVPGDRLPIYRGSYQGVGGYGSTNANTITFPFKPNAVVISHPSGVTSGSTTTYYVTLPMVYGCGMGFVSLSTTAREAPYNIPLHLTWEGNTLTWYYIKTDNNGASYQMNLPTETYEYIAW